MARHSSFGSPAATPAHSLAWAEGDYIYATRGGDTLDSWRYRISGNAWEVLHDTPRDVDDGGAMTFADGATYALRGANKVDFWRYESSNEWMHALAWTLITDAPAAVQTDGALATDGDTDLYPFQGGDSVAFWSHDISRGQWSTLANSPVLVKDGGTVVYANGYVYSLHGDGSTEFRRYNLSTASGDAPLTTTPASVDWGAALASNGADVIYALHGNGEPDFWEYSISLDQWSSLDDAPGNVAQGGALAYVNGVVYALRGGGTSKLWGYTDGSGWDTLANPPAEVHEGGDYLYALGGDATTRFWRYSIEEDRQESLRATPESVDDGGALVYLDGALYALRGDVTDDLWRFVFSAETSLTPGWGMLDVAPLEVTTGAALTTDGTDLYTLRGASTPTFWMYDVSDGTWRNLADASAAVGNGAALTYTSGYVYSLRGDSTAAFRRYDVIAGTWSAPLAGTPSTVNGGGTLLSDGSDRIYAFRGGGPGRLLGA